MDHHEKLCVCVCVCVCVCDLDRRDGDDEIYPLFDLFRKPLFTSVSTIIYLLFMIFHLPFKDVVDVLTRWK